MEKNRMQRPGVLAAIAAGSLTLVACGAPAPEVGAVDVSSAGGAAISSAPLPAGAQPGPPGNAGRGNDPTAGGQAAGVDGEYEVVAGDAATARFAVAGQQVTLLDLVVTPGWQQVRDDLDYDEVELVFVQEQNVVQLDAEIDDGRFETNVEIDSPAAPARITYPVAEAGTVTIDVTSGFVALVSQEAAPGWVATVDERELAEGEVEIQFRNDGARRSVEFDADTDDGRLNVELDSRTGVNHFVPRPNR